jgi:hypothetical protein
MGRYAIGDYLIAPRFRGSADWELWRVFGVCGQECFIEAVSDTGTWRALFEHESSRPAVEMEQMMYGLTAPRGSAHAGYN